jgi:hypothetical protein
MTAFELMLELAISQLRDPRWELAGGLGFTLIEPAAGVSVQESRLPIHS